MGLKVIEEPSTEPVSLEEARLHLGVTAYDTDGHPNDSMIQGFISAARTWVEEWTGLSIALKTYELALDEFPDFDEIELPMSPVLDITSVSYVDEDLVEQVISASDIVLDNYQRPAWLLPAVDFEWPATGAVVNAVKVRYRAGFLAIPDTDEPQGVVIPGAIKSAVLLMLDDFYENRGQVITGSFGQANLGVHSLLRPYRVRLGMA
jgi:uncharacterized phiE125 gp8 family phage protein